MTNLTITPNSGSDERMLVSGLTPHPVPLRFFGVTLLPDMPKAQYDTMCRLATDGYRIVVDKDGKATLELTETR